MVFFLKKGQKEKNSRRLGNDNVGSKESKQHKKSFKVFYVTTTATGQFNI